MMKIFFVVMIDLYEQLYSAGWLSYRKDFSNILQVLILDQDLLNIFQKEKECRSFCDGF